MSAKPKSESSDHDGSDITNESSSNSTTSSSSQESWFKSLKRNLSSKRKGGKQARSGGNIREPSSQQAAGRLNKSEWDICHSGTELTGLDFTNVKMSEKSVVSGLDLAHSHQNKGNTCLGAMPGTRLSVQRRLGGPCSTPWMPRGWPSCSTSRPLTRTCCMGSSSSTWTRAGDSTCWCRLVLSRWRRSL